MNFLDEPIETLLSTWMMELTDSDSPDNESLLCLRRAWTRQANIKRARGVHQATVERQHRAERDLLAQEAVLNEARVAQVEAFLNHRAGLCTVAIQPRQPTKALLSLQDLKSKIDGNRVSGSSPFPSYHAETVPGGLLFSEFSVLSGWQRCQQIYTNGLIYETRNITIRRDGKEYLNWGGFAERLALSLRFSQNLLAAVEYHDGITVSVFLDEMQSCIIPPLMSGYRDHIFALLPSYSWEFNFSVENWTQSKAIKESYIDIFSELCWGLGFGEMTHDQIKTCIGSILPLLS